MKKIEVSESALESLKAMAQKLQEQRDMLLATLLASREALQFASEGLGAPITGTIWMMHRPKTLFDFMDCAIAACQESTKVIE